MSDIAVSKVVKTTTDDKDRPDHESTAEAREQDVEAAMGAGKPPIPKPGLMSANCQYCGKAIKRKLAADLKLALEIHEASCTERPKEQKPGIKKMTPAFPEIPEEEKKMEENTTEMKNEEKTAWNEDAWNGATQGNFATYNEAGIAEVLFTANDFEIGKPDKWGRTPYEFAVIQNTKSVILSVAAIRLMYALKRMLPLEGKRINIIRTGSGMDTQYEVQEVAI